MTSVELVVANPSGLHARPAALFVQTAQQFDCVIRVANLTTGSAATNAKSILSLLTLGVLPGHVIRVEADGDDERAATSTLRELVTGGLGEGVTA